MTEHLYTLKQVIGLGCFVALIGFIGGMSFILFLDWLWHYRHPYVRSKMDDNLDKLNETLKEAKLTLVKPTESRDHWECCGSKDIGG